MLCIQKHLIHSFVTPDPQLIYGDGLQSKYMNSLLSPLKESDRLFILHIYTTPEVTFTYDPVTEVLLMSDHECLQLIFL